MDRQSSLASRRLTLAIVWVACGCVAIGGILGCGRKVDPPTEKTVDATATNSVPPSEKDADAAPNVATVPLPANRVDLEGWFRDAPRETWDVIYLRGSKVGHARTTIETTQSGDETFVEIADEHHLEIKRFEQSTRQSVFVSSSEKADGTFLTGTVRISSDGGPAQETRFDRVEDGLRIEKAVSGKKETFVVPFRDSTSGLYGLEESLFSRPMKPGETRNVRYLLPVIDQVIDTELVAFKIEEAELLDGEKRDLLRIEATQSIGGQEIVTVMWTDETGESLKSYVPAMEQATYRATREVALREGEPVEFDLGLDYVAKAKLPPPETLTEAIFDVYVEGADAAKIFPSSGAQRVESLPGGGARIWVRRVGPTGRYVPPAETIPPMPADGASNSLIQSDDPAVLAFAESVAPDEKDDWTLAVELERAVHETIAGKNLSKAFLSAAETMTLREGDCTEHAVLLAAALRARDIPAKVSIGLTYVPGYGGFAYHMWTEAWINDRWIPLDATTARGGTSASYLKLADTSLAGAGPYAAFLPAVKVLGRLRVETVGVTLFREERSGEDGEKRPGERIEESEIAPRTP